MTMSQHAHGYGLRAPHHGDHLERGVRGVDVVEVITENVVGRGGRPRAVLERVRRDVPVLLHGVSLSIGGPDPLDARALADLRALVDEIQPGVVSDHLCFGSVGGHHGHDLWPIPFTAGSLAHVVARIGQAQDALGRRIALENVSSYVEYRASDIPEWEFLGEVALRADCHILLDVNNVHVSAHNHGFSAETYIDALPVGRVAQYHLAGHLDRGAYLLDDHASAVTPEVWRLYARAVARFGAAPAIVEWDGAVPTLDRLVAECDRARAVAGEMRAHLAPVHGPPESEARP